MAFLLDEFGEHHILRVELGTSCAQDVPGQPERRCDVSAMSHRFEQVEGDAIFGILPAQIAVAIKCLAHPGHAHPHLMRGTFVGIAVLVVPRIKEIGVCAVGRLAAQDAPCAGQLAIADRSVHQREFARGDRPSGIGQVDVSGARRGEEL
jgi:hypothetical protein